MHRIDTMTAQKDKFGAGKNGFTRGNPQTGVPATDLDDDYFDTLQEELAAIIEDTGNALDKTKRNQVLTALKKLFAPANDTIGALAVLVGAANKLPYFTGINAATLTDLTSVGRQIIGKTSIADVLTYLGLGEGSSLPVGVPIPWPSATPPTGWLKCNGAAFTAAQYPKLAQAYPALKLPDLRGVFIRGWDDGRGIDADRSLISYAADKLKAHTHALLFGNGGGYETPAVHEGYRNSASSVYFAAAGSSGSYIREEGSNETAPCNVAFNYIVRAA